MRVEQIKIEPFEFIELRKLHIEQNINEHAKAEVVMLLKDGWEESYIDKLSKETWVKVTGIEGVPEDSQALRRILFCGIITDFDLFRDGYETLLKLQLMSGTVLMDMNPHFRVFQNKNARSGDICQKITASYFQGYAECIEGAAEQMDSMMVQYQETDWEFLKRLVGREGLYIVPDTVKKGAQYTIGLPRGIKREMKTDRVKIRFHAQQYMEKVQNGMGYLQSADMAELELTDREVYQLGDRMSYSGREYFIYRMQTEYESGEYVHRYYWRTKNAIRPLPVYNNKVTGCSFDAIVTGVQKDKVQVDIVRDEWGGLDGKKWFPYSTVYSSADGTGWYCMPEVGDAVRLYVPDKEENSFIMSSVHRETDKSRQNPDYKSFRNRYGKEILFTPDTIIMTNNQGMMVELSDKEGINIVSDKDITIEAADNLTIASSTASLLVAAEEKVQVKQGSTTMTLKDDITFTGGEFRIQ